MKAALNSYMHEKNYRLSSKRMNFHGRFSWLRGYMYGELFSKDRIIEPYFRGLRLEGYLIYPRGFFTSSSSDYVDFIPKILQVLECP